MKVKVRCIKSISSTFEVEEIYTAIIDNSINQINVFDKDEMDIALDLENARMYFEII